MDALTQLQMWQAAEMRAFNLNRAFLEMISDPTNPLTNQDLERLIAKRPDVYGRFAGFIGKLMDEKSPPSVEQHSEIAFLPCTRCAEDELLEVSDDPEWGGLVGY